MTPPPAKARLIPGLLAGLCLVLGWLVFELYRGPAEPVAGDGAAADQDLALEPLPPEPTFSMPPIEDYAETIERPIFATNRRPSTTPSPQVAAPEPTELSFVLEGVVITAAERWALLRPNGGGDVIRLAEGGRIGGWEVIAIHPDRVSLRRDDAETELELVFKLPPPATQKQPTRPRRARRVPDQPEQ